MKGLAIFISGSGTNLQAIMDAIGAGTLDAEIVLVVSNRKAAYGLVRAQEAGIPTLYFPLKPYTDVGKDRAQYDADLAAEVAPYKPDLIVLAGWMHIFSPAFLNAFPQRVINLHPALPGAFAGINAIERTFEAYQNGDILHGGCMVHYVIPEIDAGAVIVQEVVPIYPEDVLADFEARLHAAEHRLLVEAVRRCISL
jgi:formyltetrahydrofolate-dependent phosphoribosylglycinamide formyltransferase